MDAVSILKKIDKKLMASIRRNKGAIPAVTLNGHYDNRADSNKEFGVDDGLCWWTNGFWGGIANLMYFWTGNPVYMDVVKEDEELLDRCYTPSLFPGLHHDTGFMWLPLSVARYMQDKNEESKNRGLMAATVLAGRFNPEGFIRAWNDNNGNKRLGWSIIDSMMNISLLYWATAVTADPRFAKIATIHASTTMKNAVREDGSVRHITEYDPQTGKYVCEHGGQGYAEGSAWTRGQSWGIYGFLNAYKHTGKKEFLDTSEKIAEFAISHIPGSYHIPVDYLQPEEPAIEDSTAAAITASALIDLAKETGKKKYMEVAVRLLEVLDEDRSDYSADTDGILLKCTGSYHGTWDREIGFVYADYYYIEALLKLENKCLMIW